MPPDLTGAAEARPNECKAGGRAGYLGEKRGPVKRAGEWGRANDERSRSLILRLGRMMATGEWRGFGGAPKAEAGLGRTRGGGRSGGSAGFGVGYDSPAEEEEGCGGEGGSPNGRVVLIHYCSTGGFRNGQYSVDYGHGVSFRPIAPSSHHVQATCSGYCYRRFHRPRRRRAERGVSFAPRRSFG